MHFERSTRGCVVSTDPSRIDLNVVHAYLSTAYWSPGVTREVVARSIRGSLCFGLYDDAAGQIGFARVITDCATYAYLADVFVLPAHQGKGMGTFLIESIMLHPELQGLRRWMLATRDAHELYRRVGFKELRDPMRFMEIRA
jgi:GNAT superfamily N-acetyltransferase